MVALTQNHCLDTGDSVAIFSLLALRPMPVSVTTVLLLLYCPRMTCSHRSVSARPRTLAFSARPVLQITIGACVGLV